MSHPPHLIKDTHYNQPPPHVTHQTPIYVNMISSGCGSILTGLTMTPLDVVSKRIQAIHINASVSSTKVQKHLTIASTLRNIVQTDGIRRLWTGLGAGLFMSLPNTIFYFSTYEAFRRKLSIYQYSYINKHFFHNNPHSQHHDKLGLIDKVILSPIFPPFIAGLLARLICSSITAPIELIRTRQQTYISPAIAHESHAPSFLSVFREISSKNSLTALYRGLVPTLLRDCPFSALYWTMNDNLKRILTNYYLHGTCPSDSTARTPQDLLSNHSHHNPQNKSHLSTWTISLISGATAGMTASIITHPFEVVKTTTQISDRNTLASLPTNSKTAVVEPKQVSLPFPDLSKAGTIRTFNHILQHQGVKGLFIGLTPRVLKTAPSCAIMLSSYDLVRKIIDKRAANHFMPGTAPKPTV